MTFALAPVTGSGTLDDPFGVDGAQAIVDLRSDSTVASGYALAYMAEGVSAPSLSVTLTDLRLPEAATDTLSQSVLDTLMDLLGITLDSEELGSVAAEILLSGKEDGTRWKPLKKQSDGWWRVFCGGLLWEQSSIDGGASYSDDFSGDLSGWTRVDGGWTLDGGEVKAPVLGASDGFPSILRFDSPLDSADHWAQDEFTQQANDDSLMGPAVRIDATGAKTTYDAVVRATNNNRQIRKEVNGAASQVVDFGGGGPAPRTVRLEIDGSTLTLYDEAALVDEPSKVGDATDTEITGNLHTGLIAHSSTVNTGWGDNFLTEDVDHDDTSESAVTPASRMLTVDSEDRTLVVAAENRTLQVKAEDRTLTVKG